MGETWTLIPADGIGTGVGALPAGAAVVIDAVLPAFSPGVQQVDENTVCSTHTYTDYAYDDSGVLVEAPNSRVLAFSESDFLALFAAPGGGV